MNDQQCVLSVVLYKRPLQAQVQFPL